MTTKALTEELSQTIEFFTESLVRAMQGLTTRDLQDVFIVVHEPMPNSFHVTANAFVARDNTTKEELFFTRRTANESSDPDTLNSFNKLETLISAALTMIQLTLKSVERESPAGLRFYHSLTEKHTHGEVVYSDEPALTATDWVRKTVEENPEH